MRILDTDTCIAILRGQTRVIERRRQVPDHVATTRITAGELYYGAAKSRAPIGNKRLVDAFLATLQVLEMDEAASQLFGILKAELESLGKRLMDADLWIAATALNRKAILVTGNDRYFKRIQKLGLENWMIPVSGA